MEKVGREQVERAIILYDNCDMHHGEMMDLIDEYTRNIRDEERERAKRILRHYFPDGELNRILEHIQG